LLLVKNCLIVPTAGASSQSKNLQLRIQAEVQETSTMSSSSSSSYTKPAPKFDLSKPNPTYKLAGSGAEMPVVAYGTFRSQPGEVGPAVVEAIKAGYRHFDLAHV
jgi:hypothetical protein